MIASAAQLKGADWQQFVHNLAQAVGEDQLQVSSPQYGMSSSGMARGATRSSASQQQWTYSSQHTVGGAHSM